MIPIFSAMTVREKVRKKQDLLVIKIYWKIVMLFWRYNGKACIGGWNHVETVIIKRTIRVLDYLSTFYSGGRVKHERKNSVKKKNETYILVDTHAVLIAVIYFLISSDISLGLSKTSPQRLAYLLTCCMLTFVIFFLGTFIFLCILLYTYTYFYIPLF